MLRRQRADRDGLQAKEEEDLRKLVDHLSCSYARSDTTDLSAERSGHCGGGKREGTERKF